MDGTVLASRLKGTAADYCKYTVNNSTTRRIISFRYGVWSFLGVKSET